MIPALKITRITSLLALIAGLIACDLNETFKHTTQMGDTDICIPNRVSSIVGSSPVFDKNSDQPVPIVQSMAIPQGDIKKDLPEYTGEIIKDDKIIYLPLYSTILRYEPFQGQKPVSATSEADYFFSKDNSKLVGEVLDPRDYWNAFEIQSDQSRKYWGVCWYQSFDPNNYLNCRRSIEIEGLEFQYYVSHSNIDLYPKIDSYLKNKVAEWHCE